ncbi:GTP-binding protein [Desulfurivibrio dismutans]|uniref:GTP-binding protein n=1 Tax=Desulfurivibrio dismutans TaxID=1398908 RepID=UPI0023DA77B7|nr:GTPase domain-containing protein [Desulfurivibrio alkaliphilus]MDF1615306.1 GTPase domain-containing protein [Desulfurivibrio alkaliphilus]
MALIDLSKREVHCKIVYCGPGRCGKTTNLLSVYESMAEKDRGKMLTIDTKGDRTLFFDLLPLNLGTIRGFNIRIQLYTVPGQTMYEATRKLVLKGVDGLVFVADPLKVRRQSNIESLDDLRRHLQDYGLKIEKMPLVIQYNKRDLADTPTPTLTIEELESDLNDTLKVKTFPASAIEGVGVFETLQEISKQTVRYVANKHLLADMK